MALSYSKFTADGVDNVYPLVFPFLDKGHIKGQVDGEEVNLSVDTYYKRVTVTPVPKAGSLVVIRRRTPRDRTYSNFTGGNPFGQVNVNNSFLWQLYIAQEISEGDVSDEFFTSNDLDMGGHRIFNLGEPKTDTDAVRVKDLDAAIDKLGDVAGSSISELPPADKVAGRRWTRCSDMKSFIWYVDNGKGQWVEDNPSMGGYTKPTVHYGTVEQIAAGHFDVGDSVTVTDRANGIFEIVSGGVADGFGILAAGSGRTAVMKIKDKLNLAWLTVLDGITSNDAAIEWAINNGYQIYLPPKSVTRKTIPTVTDKDIVIISDKGRGAKLANDCDNGVTAFTQNGTNSKIFHLEGFEITNPNLKTNKIANSDLNILSYTLKDLLVTDSFNGFFSARQWVSPSFDDVIFRNTNMTAAQLAGVKCIYMEKCNTVDLSKVSLTGAWDCGVHLKNIGGEGNFTVSIGTFTAQGVNNTDKLIGKALWIEGGDAIRVGTLYVEKTREEDCLLIENATGVTFDTCHIVQGSLTLNNCQSNLTSVTNYVVSGADPAGLSTIKVIGGRADISNLGNYNDYNFRYEKGDGTGVITGHLKDAIQIPAAVINSGSVGSATAAANTQLVNLGFTGALRITTTAVNSGYKFGIASANLNDGDNFIIAARVRVVSGGGKVRTQKIGGSATMQKFPVLHTWATASDEFQTIFFYGTKTADGASCQFTANIPCVFDLIVTSYIGW